MKAVISQACCGTCHHWYQAMGCDGEPHGHCCWPNEARASATQIATTDLAVCTAWRKGEDFDERLAIIEINIDALHAADCATPPAQGNEK